MYPNLTISLTPALALIKTLTLALVFAVCKDFPNWEDRYETTCARHEGFGNCKDGKLGNGLTNRRLDEDVKDTGFPPAYKACWC